MPKDSILNNSEFMDLVRICHKRRLLHKEALVVLHEAGFTINSKTYQRAIRKLEETNSERYKQIANEFGGYALDTIDTSTAIDSELWNIIRNASDEWVKISALGLILKNCNQKSNNVEINPILARIAQSIQKKSKNSLQQSNGDKNDLEENKAS